MANIENTIRFRLVTEGNRTFVKGVKQRDAALKKSAKSSVLATRNQRNLRKETHKTAGAFSVFRSKLLLASFAGSLFAMSVGRLTKMMGEQETAEKKLETAIGKRSKALLAFASAQQKVTTFGDEETISAMSLLGAYTENEKAIARLTQASMDLSTAKGLDLKTSVDLVAKSIFSSTNALSRYGISVEGSTGSTRRLESAVKNISDLYGGQAVADANTYAGSMKQLANSAGDVGEKIGEAIAPSIMFAARGLKLFADSIDTEEVKAYGTAVIGVGGAWVAFTKGAVIAQKAMLLLNKVSKKNIMIFGAMVTIGAVIDKFNLFADSTSDLDAELKELEGDLGALNSKGNNSLSLNHKLAMSNLLLAQSYQKTGDALRNVFNTANEFGSLDVFTAEQQILSEQFRSALEKHNVTSEEYGLGLVENKEALVELNGITVKQLELEHRASEAKRRAVSGLVSGFLAVNQAVKGNAIVSKRLAQVQAVIDTYSAANKALASAPPPFNYIAMAGVIAQGLANVRQIEAQKFARGGEFVTNKPEMIMVGEAGREHVKVTPIDRPESRALKGEQTINVNISGGIVQEDYVSNELIPEINRAISLGSRIGS